MQVPLRLSRFEEVRGGSALDPGHPPLEWRGEMPMCGGRHERSRVEQSKEG